MERTADLNASEARFRTLVEHATEAIVVFDGVSGRFDMVNENAERLFGRSREALLQLTPADVSPPFQPDGRSSAEGAREKVEAALAGGKPVFEWVHRHSDGRLFNSEVRLVHLPGERSRLVRASIIDHTERKRREQVQGATYEISEAVHRTADLDRLYERIHSIIGGLMPAKNFYIALFDPATERICFPYFVDESAPAQAPLAPGTGLTSYVLRTGEPLLVGPEMNARKRQSGSEVTFEGFPGLSYREKGGASAIWLGVPLIIQGKTIGVMAVQDYHNAEAYGEEEKQILTFVAEQTALAIERKRAEQTLRHRADQVQRHRNVLLELAKLDKSDFDRAIGMICSRAASTMSVARVSYWSLKEEGRALVCEHLFLSERGEGDESAKGRFLGTRDCASYFAALARKEPIVAHHAEKHPATVELSDSYLRPLGIGSMLDLPVWLHGQVVGVLCHEHVGEPREWMLEEIDFASSLAAMTALSIEAAQRARSEHALRESEQKFRALFEATSTAVMIHDTDPNLEIMEVNAAAVRIFGCGSAAELVGQSPVTTSPPFQPGGVPTVELARKRMEECYEQGTARFDWMARRADGSDIPVEVILTRINMGGRRRIQAVVNDISERKRAEAELRESAARLRESEARFSAAFHASPMLSAISRLEDGRFVEANEAFVNWTGYSREEVLGRSSAELNLWMDPEERAAFFAELEVRGRVRHRECAVCNRSGATHTMLLSADRIELNGRPHVLTVALDITDRKRAEMGMWRALERERELSQLKNNFVSMVSHEFRTPLGIILSSAQILSDYLDRLSKGERREHLEAISSSSKRMASLMEEVLVLSRVESGKLAFEPAALDLAHVCRRLIDEVRSATAGSNPIDLVVRCDATEARADERLLRHIFINLLTNAVKYSPAAAPVVVRLDREEQDAVCLIRDQGIGIPDADQERLFNPFHRGSNVGQVAGSGLGLVIVKRCVELHGGSLRVDSQTGQGTTVTVRLPLFSENEGKQ